MIKIEFNIPSSNTWRVWCAKCQRKTGELIDCYENDREAQVTNLYKQKSIKDEVFLAKDGPFHGKCAYCECNLIDFQHGDIEHFRPKKAVTDENDNVVNITDAEGRTIPHPGYYWLAYDWTNLLPSCAICNQPSTANGEKRGKRNRFPVEKGHALKPSELVNEKPLLINPTVEDPSDHLEVDENGYMIPKTDRGRMCIKVFGLNVRDQLVDERRRAMTEALAILYKIIMCKGEERREAVSKLKKIRAGEFAYSLAGRASLNEVEPHLSEGLAG